MNQVLFDQSVVCFIRGSLTSNALSKAVFRHVAGRVFAPRDVLTVGRVVKNEIRYVPYYRFTGQYDAKWSATFVFKHVERRQEWKRRHVHDDRGNWSYENVPVNKKHVTWDKMPESGDDVGEFDIREYAGREFSPAMLRKLTDFAAHATVLRETDTLPEGDPTCEPCTVPPQNVFDQFVKPKVDTIIDKAVKQHAQGDRQSDWHFSASLSNLTATIVAVPVGHAIFEYQGQKYHYWVSAVDPRRVVADKGPVDKVARRRGVLGLLTLGLWLLTPNPQKRAENARTTAQKETQGKSSLMSDEPVSTVVTQDKMRNFAKEATPLEVTSIKTQRSSQKSEARKSIFGETLLGLLPLCTTFLFFPILATIVNKQISNLEAGLYALLLLLCIFYAVMRWRGLRASKRLPQKASFLGTTRDTRIYLPIMVVAPLIIAILLGLVSPHASRTTSAESHHENTPASHAARDDHPQTRKMRL